MTDSTVRRGEPREDGETHTGACTAPPPQVRQKPGKSVYWASDEPENVECHRDFLDTVWEIVSTVRLEVVAKSSAAGGTRRAFFFSKHHARCVSVSRNLEVLCQGII
jgi:hypothetical protein